MYFYEKGGQQKKYKAMHFPNSAVWKTQQYFITMRL